MTPPRLALALAVLLLAWGPPAQSAEYTRTFVLREPLGHTWTDELVHRDEKIDEPRVPASAFALTDAQGKPVPLQVEVLEGRPEAVRRVRLWFKVTLPKGTEVPLRLFYGDAARRPEAREGDASVRRDAQRLVLSSPALAVAVPAPQKPFEKPVEFKDAPPPILGLRPAGTEAWYGAWRLAGPARVREIRSTIEAPGPVWVQVRLRYVFEKEHVYEVVLRMVGREPWADVQERCALPDGCRLTATLAGALKPAEAIWMPWVLLRGGRPQPSYDARRLPLDRLGPGEEFATIRPRWARLPGATQVCLAAGRGEGAPAVGLIATAPADWQRPYDHFVTARATEARDGVALDFPLGQGRRRWLLVAGPAEHLDSKAELQGLIRAAADLPLDRVLNEWILQWPRDASRPAPHLLTTWPRLQQLREDLAAGRDTPETRLVRDALEGPDGAARPVAEFLAGRRETLDVENPAPAVYLDRCYQDDFLRPGAYPRRLAQALPLLDLASAGRPAGDAAAAVLGYIFSDPNYWPTDSGGWEAGARQRPADLYAVALYAAALMPDHPHARRWAAPALAALRNDLRRALAPPASAGPPAPAVTAQALEPLLALARCAQNARLDDPLKGHDIRGALEWLRHLHTPVDPRLGRRLLAPIGDAAPWQDDVGSLFGLAAAGLPDTDAATAALWAALHRHYPAPAAPADFARALLAAGPAGPAADLAAGDWASRAWPGFGAVLRSRFGSDRETFVAMKCGPSRTRYHGDELALHFYGAGRPIALDWNAGPPLRIEQEHMHNRVSLGDSENLDGAGELLAFATSDAADVAVGQVRSPRLRQVLRYPHETPEPLALPRRTLPAEARCRRFLLLVKHPSGPLEDYLVIRDEVAATEPATFNLFVLARGVRQEGRTFVFDGQLDADAFVFFAAPDPAKVRLDRWAWPRQDESSLIPKDFRPGAGTWRTGELQHGLHVTTDPNPAFLVVLYPARKGADLPTFETLADGRGVRVTLAGATEDVYLATDPPPDAGGQAVVRRNGQAAVILKPGTVRPLGRTEDK